MRQELRSEHLSIAVNSHGAELCSIKNRNGTEFIWQADPSVWARHAPLLFPIVGKLKDNTFIFDGKSYTLPQHGFARDLEFVLTRADETSCSFELRSTPETRIKYPFDFVLTTDYCLDNNKIVVSHNVRNPSKTPLFFSIGAHPGFNCPATPNERFEDHYLEFEKDQYVITLLQNGQRTSRKDSLRLKDKRLFLSPSVFDQDALVFEKGQIDRLTFSSLVSGPVLTLECSGWPWFGIWSKKGASRFVCLEPWQGVTDHETATQRLEDKEGIIRLEAGAVFNCSYSIIIHS